MADILEKGLNTTKPAGLRTPKQFSTIEGPGVRINNQYDVVKQPKLSISGKGNK